MDLDHRPFTTDLLSVREREVLDLAVDGLTDERIAQALGISVSTVNSYWVRIRGKVGQLSRTEIVGGVLRQESRLRYADLIAENSRLKESERAAQEDLAQSKTDLRAVRGGSWHLLALDHAADAMLVCKPPGHTVYANLRAQYLFAAEPGELENLALWDLTIPEDREWFERETPDLILPESPPRVVIGVERPYYGLRRNGENFRGHLVVERFLSSEGMMAVVTVREFLDGVEEIVRGLRRPYKVL